MAGAPRINLLGGFVGSSIFVAAARRVTGDGGVEEAAEVLADRMRELLDRPGQGKQHRSLPNRSSAPGDPPARQLDGLIDAIEVWKEGKSWRVGVPSDVEAAVYAIPLEYGNSHIAPRPFMRPAAASAESGMLNAAAKSLVETLLARQALGLIRSNFR